ncbi:DsrE family protein [Marinobacter oulmenensis]|uniref:tRNA 2-thiouridine synthesizing protein C n=1 Tax=Marinobacter oulmenensis TaxID=643747 RepID=A0A840U4F9_9GAMM|nr:DsrE family protein [Marinobacter oulmenensis]MBB5320604.1 tRNA 2-thiouridine synthesizing protein C [Marinobacter oulmenensis]
MTTLMIIDQAPYGSWSGREALDMALSLSAFDQSVALLFTGSGVNWLRRGQASDAIGQKSVEKNLSAAPLFGIETLLATRKDCERYSLTETDRLPGVTLVDTAAEAIADHDHVLFAG